jgi:hypothetical protein
MPDGRGEEELWREEEKLPSGLKYRIKVFVYKLNP